MKKKIYQQPKVVAVNLAGSTILAGSNGVNAQQLNYEEVDLSEDFE